MIYLITSESLHIMGTTWSSGCGLSPRNLCFKLNGQHVPCCDSHNSIVRIIIESDALMHLHDRISIGLGYSGRRWSSGWLLLSCWQWHAAESSWVAGAPSLVASVGGGASTATTQSIWAHAPASVIAPGGLAQAGPPGPVDRGGLFSCPDSVRVRPWAASRRAGRCPLLLQAAVDCWAPVPPMGDPSLRAARGDWGHWACFLPTVSYKTWDVTYNGVQRTISQYLMLTHDIKECTVSLKEVHMTQFG